MENISYINVLPWQAGGAFLPHLLDQALPGEHS
jgi:hypothetical protein